ncbi:MAG: penicillin-binding protein 2 [Dehalococcoidia bacterium]
MKRAETSPWRMRAIATVFVVFGVLLVLRLVQVQIIDHPRFEQDARDIHFWTQQVDGPRGSILDRNGFPLVTSIDTFEVHVDREAWELDAANERLAVEGLARRLGAGTDQIRNIVFSGSGRDVLLALNVPYGLGEAIIAEGLPGVKVSPSSLRRYAEGGLASQILGFVGRDNQGLAGVEFDFDAVLSGKPGRVVFERDSLGNPIPFGTQTVQPIQPGADLVLTIDRTLQRIAERHLAEALEQTGARGGAILIMEPKTGDILAIAAAPTFDVAALDLSDAGLDLSIFRNRAITDLYEPGSVFKVVTMAAALDAGIVTPDSTFVDTGAIVVGARTIRNFDLSFHGRQTMTQLLQRSLNTGAAWVSQQLGADLFYWYLRQFGFGRSTRSGLSGEAEGIVKEPGNLFWSEVDLATNSFGQGISVTPLQIVRAYAAIANGGNLVRPRIVRAVITEDGVRAVPTVIERQVIREDTAAQLRRMMQAVVDGVVGHPAQTPGWPVAGKSGTSDIAEDGVYLEGESIATFAGFAPVDDPRLVVLIKLDRPQGQLFGGVIAAPVFSAVMADALPYLGVPPTQYVARPNLFDPAPEGTGPRDDAERTKTEEDFEIALETLERASAEDDAKNGTEHEVEPKPIGADPVAAELAQPIDLEALENDALTGNAEAG